MNQAQDTPLASNFNFIQEKDRPSSSSSLNPIPAVHKDSTLASINKLPLHDNSTLEKIGVELSEPFQIQSPVMEMNDSLPSLSSGTSESTSDQDETERPLQKIEHKQQESSLSCDSPTIKENKVEDYAELNLPSVAATNNGTFGSLPSIETIEETSIYSNSFGTIHSMGFQENNSIVRKTSTKRPRPVVMKIRHVKHISVDSWIHSPSNDSFTTPSLLFHDQGTHIKFEETGTEDGLQSRMEQASHHENRKKPSLPHENNQHNNGDRHHSFNGMCTKLLDLTCQYLFPCFRSKK